MKLASPVGRRHTRIEIIPLIDIMFFLLASFMMVSLQMSKTQNRRVELPLAWESQADFNARMINIAVDAQGGLWLERQPVTLEALRGVLSARFQADTNLPVYISADGATGHGRLTPLYRLVREVGVQKVSFMVASPVSGAVPGLVPP